MPKTKKYSLSYRVQKCMNAWTPEKDILAAVQEFIQNGTHSQIEFSDTPLEFAHALYLERFKRGTPWAGFFPTPVWLADRAAALLGVQPRQVVLDPCCGFGSLSQAVERRGGVPIWWNTAMRSCLSRKRCGAQSACTMPTSRMVSGHALEHWHYRWDLCRIAR